jgi:hypothetical protein
MSSSEYTRWGIVASGEGGGRIASQFFDRTDNPGIDDRVVIMNTNRADLRNTIDRIKGNVSQANDDDVAEKYTLAFGEQQGAGNFFPNGEACARNDIDGIVDKITEFGIADAFMYLATLGGGTGNGSIPYIVEQIQSDFAGIDQSIDATEWIGSTIHTTFSVWPHYYEQPQRHFNAVSGLSRLLRTSDGDQNADLVLLAANSHIEDDENGHQEQYGKINQAVIDAIDLMIGAGRETRSVIDVKDYVTIPSQMDAYHFTPAVATDLNGDVYELEFMLDQAADNAYVPMDIESTTVAYLIVRAPEGMIEDDDISEPDVYNAFREWTDDHNIDAAGQASLTPKRGRGTDVDVMLLLGGFDLNPLLDHSWDQFETWGENLTGNGGGRGGEDLSKNELDKITRNLNNYVEKNAN